MEEKNIPRIESIETAEEWAHRMTGKLCGVLKEEIAACGGAEAFIRWVRSGDEDTLEDAKSSME